MEVREKIGFFGPELDITNVSPCGETEILFADQGYWPWPTQIFLHTKKIKHEFTTK